MILFPKPILKNFSTFKIKFILIDLTEGERFGEGILASGELPDLSMEHLVAASVGQIHSARLVDGT